MQCNVVGTNLALMQFYEKGIHCRTWGNVATSCEMWESELNFFFFFFLLPSFPDLCTEITKVAHAGLFANVATNCQTSSSHFLCIPFILGGKHQLPPLDFHPLFSSSIWLSPVHFLLRLPAPDPVGSASASSRQVEIKGGRSRAANVLSMAGVSHETRGLSVSPFFFLSFCICWSHIHLWSMQILDGAFD